VTDLAAVSWTEFERLAGRSRLALVPVGAVEANGPHLAQGLDNYVADALARAVAERAGGFVAPLVPVGWSERLEGPPGMLNVDPHVLEAYCEGIARSLIANGLDRILFVNGHGGNTFSLDLVCHRLDREFADARLAHVELWKFLQPLSEDLVEGTKNRFGHAGEMPTSLLLYLRPDLVDMQAAEEAGPGVPDDPFGLVRPRPYRDRMPRGTLGDSRLASADKGRVLFERMTATFVEFVTDPGW